MCLSMKRARGDAPPPAPPDICFKSPDHQRQKVIQSELVPAPPDISSQLLEKRPKQRRWIEKRAKPRRWSEEEDAGLAKAVAEHGPKNWKMISELVPGRNHTQCLQRWSKVLRPGLIKGHWTDEEDATLKTMVTDLAIGGTIKSWSAVADRIGGRTSKQCRERWFNHLDPNIKRGDYSSEEDHIILAQQGKIGNRWSLISAMLPGRTEDAVKIRCKILQRIRNGFGPLTGQGKKTTAPQSSPTANPTADAPGAIHDAAAAYAPGATSHHAADATHANGYACGCNTTMSADHPNEHRPLYEALHASL